MALFHDFVLIPGPAARATGSRPRRSAGGLARLVASAALLAGVVPMLNGCGQALLTSADERSQYDRYDRVRNEFAQQTVEDEFGRRLPNLRGRLSPKD
jgi:hypothetical protein